MSPGLTRTLLVLTFVTGVVDATSFLGLGQATAAAITLAAGLAHLRAQPAPA